MGAYTCQYGTVHKRCRCPEPHAIRCPTPAVCDNEGTAYVPRHRADFRLLGEDVSGHAMGPAYRHGGLLDGGEARECVWHARLRRWVTFHEGLASYVECLYDDHPTAAPPTVHRPRSTRGVT
jgi:hypothetical protein